MKKLTQAALTLLAEGCPREMVKTMLAFDPSLLLILAALPPPEKP